LLKDMNEKIDQIITETSTLASRNDLTVLNKYVDFWKPMNFVTREQLDRELKYSKK